MESVCFNAFIGDIKGTISKYGFDYDQCYIIRILVFHCQEMINFELHRCDSLEALIDKRKAVPVLDVTLNRKGKALYYYLPVKDYCQTAAPIRLITGKIACLIRCFFCPFRHPTIYVPQSVFAQINVFSQIATVWSELSLNAIRQEELWLDNPYSNSSERMVLYIGYDAFGLSIFQLLMDYKQHIVAFCLREKNGQAITYWKRTKKYL